MKESWMTLKQIAEHLGVSKETIYRYLHRNQIPAYKVGKLWRFLPSEVDKAVRSRKLEEKDV